MELTHAEWEQAIAMLTATGDITDERRQEFILWSDALGLSMLVDALEQQSPDGPTESTVLGPFYVPGSRARVRRNIAEDPGAGIPAWVHGRVLAPDGAPIAGAVLDVWQNGEDMLYAVQSPEAPESHLRGRFRTQDRRLLRVPRGTARALPDPERRARGRDARGDRPPPLAPGAHPHDRPRPGYRTLTTHIFDAASEYLDSDAVFAVKPSLRRVFVHHDASSPDTPPGVTTEWYSVENDLVLAPGASAERADPERTA